MKKILLLILVSLALLSTGCGKKEEESDVKNPITEEKFTSALADYGYIVVDAIDKVDEDVAEVAKVAVKDDIILQFFVLKTEDGAKELYKKYELEFIKYEGLVTPVKKSGANYDSYKLVTDNYYISSRIDKTYVYVKVNTEHVNEVNTILDELGY